MRIRFWRREPKLWQSGVKQTLAESAAEVALQHLCQTEGLNCSQRTKQVLIRPGYTDTTVEVTYTRSGQSNPFQVRVSVLLFHGGKQYDYPMVVYITPTRGAEAKVLGYTATETSTGEMMVVPSGSKLETIAEVERIKFARDEPVPSDAPDEPQPAPELKAKSA